MLPIVAVQSRYLLYKFSYRWKSDKKQMELSELLYDLLPHDLAIMGMTLAFASTIAFAAKLSLFQSRLQILTLTVAMITFYIMSLIPLLKHRNGKLILGILAYLIGASLMVLSIGGLLA